jgi:hypothetical protein
MTSLSIVQGRYKTAPRVAKFAILSDASGPIFEYHNRKLVGTLAPEQLHQVLRKYAIHAGLLKEEA